MTKITIPPTETDADRIRKDLENERQTHALIVYSTVMNLWLDNAEKADRKRIPLPDRMSLIKLMIRSANASGTTVADLFDPVVSSRWLCHAPAIYGARLHHEIRAFVEGIVCGEITFIRSEPLAEGDDGESEIVLCDCPKCLAQRAADEKANKK